MILEKNYIKCEDKIDDEFIANHFRVTYVF